MEISAALRANVRRITLSFKLCWTKINIEFDSSN